MFGDSNQDKKRVALAAQRCEQPKCLWEGSTGNVILLRNIKTHVGSVHCLYLSSNDYILLRACTAHFLPVMMDGVMSSSARPGHLFQLEWLWSCWEAVWLVGSSELSTGKASCQMPVYAQHLRQERSLMFFSRPAALSPRQHYHDATSLNTHVSDCKHISQSSESTSSCRGWEKTNKHLNWLFLSFMS